MMYFFNNCAIFISKNFRLNLLKMEKITDFIKHINLFLLIKISLFRYYIRYYAIMQA